jgi:serine/threonine protein kinase
MIGQALGHYQIEEELGAGGMGVVYRAIDTRLGRHVAIKVLPEKFARDPERLARFEREARMLASLNHPNIAAIHELEESNGVRYLVLELVPGETLAERIKRGPLEVSETIAVCRQIAEALEAAHDKGIIHRDLKPANVKITPQDKVKVLDFGLAKAFQAEVADMDLSQSPTMTDDGTRAGAVLGTAAYMSPEQARGKPIDKRSDIWSFGCVLYECLTHRRAFGGESITDSMAAVLTKEPDWDAIPQDAPAGLQSLLRRCLQKEPPKRLRDIGDARLALEEALTAPEPAVFPQAPPRRAPVALYSACVIAGALIAALIGARLWRKPLPPSPVVRFTVSLPQGESLAFDQSSSVVISPDGTRLVYVANKGSQREIYLRAIDRLEAKPIPGTAGARNPFFSPDGEWIVFWQNFKLRKIALSGGAPVPLVDSDGTMGGSWGPDQTIIFVDSLFRGVSQVAAAGGTPRYVTAVNAKKNELSHKHPEFLPGGKAILFTVGAPDIDSYDDARIAVQPLQGGEHKILLEGGANPRYLPSGHIVYARGGTLMAVPFDLQRLAVTGPPFQVLDTVFQSPAYGTANFTLSANGSLAYAPGVAVGAGRVPVWVDRQGKAQPLPLPRRAWLHPRVSPDGRQLAIEIEGPHHDFYTYDLARGVLSKFTSDGHSHWPVWTPDGKHVTFRRSLQGGDFSIWWMPADRSSPEERLTLIGNRQSAASWSPDSHVVAFTQVDAETGADIYVLDMNSERKPRPFVQTKFNEGSPRFSPDGRWIAYCSNESGHNEVYVQAYPGPGAKIQISTDGGTDPVWAQNGTELFYRSGDKMMVVAVTLRPSFDAGKPRMLWEGPYGHGLSSLCGAPGPSSSNYDVTPDGQRFLMIREGEQEIMPTEIRVVLNWVEEVKRLASERKKAL